MHVRKLSLLLWTLCALLLFPLLSHAQETGNSRALLIAVDDFVSQPSTYPSSINNVYAMQSVFQKSQKPFEMLLIPPEQTATLSQLEALIEEAFAGATEDDISYLYLSTHGVYDPLQSPEPYLLLSDGQTEEHLTPTLLRDMLKDVAGTKVLFIDACNSGAFIGKGMVTHQPNPFAFDDFKVITSSGAMEESWYWHMESKLQGAFYFTQILSQGMRDKTGFAADRNRDGVITLTELYDYVLQNHAASTPQVYPQVDDFPLFTYDLSEANVNPQRQSPIMDIMFSGTTLTPQSPELTIEFVALRPIRVAYQIVYQDKGKWDFDNATLLYDTAERFTAFGDLAGAMTAGHKSRTLNLGALPFDAYGYVLVQVVSIDDGQLTVHAGRVLCVPPTQGDIGLSVSVSDTRFVPGIGREMSFFVSHDMPCVLSLSVVDDLGNILQKSAREVNAQITPLQFVNCLVELTRAVCDAEQVNPNELDFVGMGIPGAVRQGNVLYTCNLPLQDIPVEAMFRASIDVPVYLENDANCAAVGEYLLGAGRGSQDFAVITLGTGVGGGFITNGKLYSGGGMVGEVGHMVIVKDGAPCGCGRRGCWEAYASATGLERLYQEKASEPSGIDKILGLRTTGKEIFEKADQGDAIALSVCQDYVSYLACGVVNLCNILQPEILAVGGGVSHAPEHLLLHPLQALVAKECYATQADQPATRIVTAQLGNDAGILGAARLKQVL